MSYARRLMDTFLGGDIKSPSVYGFIYRHYLWIGERRYLAELKVGPIWFRRPRFEMHWDSVEGTEAD